VEILYLWVPGEISYAHAINYKDEKVNDNEYDLKLSQLLKRYKA
jgi:hypothetical protein